MSAFYLCAHLLQLRLPAVPKFRNKAAAGPNSIRCTVIDSLEKPAMNWNEIFQPQVLWPIIIGLVIIVGSLADAWRKVRSREIDATLKLELIKQGRSADEIEQILHAKPRARS